MTKMEAIVTSKKSGRYPVTQTGAMGRPVGAATVRQPALGRSMTMGATIWNEMLTLLRARHPLIVRAWFSDIEFEALRQGSVFLRVANAGQQQYLQERCRPELTESAQQVTGRLIDVVVQLRPAGQTGPMPPGEPSPGLSPAHIFESFLVGPSNQLAYSAAVATADQPGMSYNPLLIFGAEGLGKTHLLQAICHRSAALRPDQRIVYLPAERFVDSFVAAHDRGRGRAFRNFVCSASVFALDQIEGLANRARSQEELFHVFESLKNTGGQLVFASRQRPDFIDGLEARLVSRLASGLLAPVEPPDREMRIAALQKYAEREAIILSEDVLAFVADRCENNYLQLHQGLDQINAESRRRGVPIDLDLAHRAFESKGKAVIPVSCVLKAASDRFGVAASDLLSRKRKREISFAREVSLWLTRRLTQLSLEETADLFGGMTLAQALQVSHSVQARAESDRQFARLLDELAAEAKNASP